VSDLHRRVFACRHVLDEGASVLDAHRNDAGELQLLCGAAAHGDDELRALQLGEMIIEHPSVVDIMELEQSERAQRPTAADPWKIVDR
jgi:hypothetical protein